MLLRFILPTFNAAVENVLLTKQIIAFIKVCELIWLSSLGKKSNLTLDKRLLFSVTSICVLSWSMWVMNENIPTRCKHLYLLNITHHTTPTFVCTFLINYLFHNYKPIFSHNLIQCLVSLVA